MYENCMLILGLEGVKLHGSAGGTNFIFEC